MADEKNYGDEVTRLVSQDKPNITELRRLMVEMDEVIHSPQFQTMSSDERDQLQKSYTELRSKIREVENPGPRTQSPQVPNLNEDGSASGAVSIPPARAQRREHNPYAEQQMEEAEKLFYGGRYAEAIKLYDQVLQIEPSWDRAQKHRNESENYMRTGYIPSVALPAETATAFGKAQSAARLGRYSDAMVLLNRAQAILREMGIQRWQEGQEFEQKLQQSIDAENVYSEGQYLFAQGQIDEGIERVETAAQATGLPKYNDRALEMRRVRTTIQSISEMLNSGNVDAKDMAQARSELEGLLVQYDQNPVLLKLKSRLDGLVPGVTGPLKDQIRTYLTQADRAQTLDAVQGNLRQANQAMDQARNLGPLDDELLQLQEEIDKRQANVVRCHDELQQAMLVLNSNRSWPAAASRMSQDLRARYPNDPGVMELNRGLSGYRTALTGIKIGIVLLAIGLIGLVFFYGFTQVRGYVLSLTPSVTPTSTFTPTPTETPTPLPTSTITPTSSPQPSLTPTPLTGVVARTVWARSGCYEKFNPIQRIPEKGIVRFLPSERRFDTFNRECVLVEYVGETSSVIGWILMSDLFQ